MRIHDLYGDDSVLTMEGTLKWLVTFTLLVGVVVMSQVAPGESRRRSLSVGGPNAGTLVHGVRLPSRSSGFLSNPNHTNREAD